MVQVIEGAGAEIAHVVGGAAETDEVGRRFLDARWRIEVEQQADTVVAAISGDPAHHEINDLARALACAARVVRPQGRIILLSEAGPSLGAGMELLRQSDDPREGYSRVQHERPADVVTAF